jgi:hypothetical protein
MKQMQHTSLLFAMDVHVCCKYAETNTVLFLIGSHPTFYREEIKTEILNIEEMSNSKKHVK